MNVFLNAIAAAVVLVGLAVNVVQAADFKSVAGATCQSYYGKQESRTNKTASGIRNVDKGHTWVSCSLPRDNVTLSGKVSVGILVNVNQRTSCYARSNHPNGAPVQTSMKTGSGWLYIPITVRAALGSYVVYCYLPPNGRLSTVLIREDGNTTTR